MDEQSARSLYEQRINQLVESLLPNGAGTMSETRLRTALLQVAQVAFSAGESYALTNLMDIEQALNEVNTQLQSIGHKPISRRRLQAIARVQHDRFGVGYNVTGTNSWLFRPSEIENLLPGKTGRPRNE